MKIINTELPGVKILEPGVFKDERGYFIETYSRKRYEEYGIQKDFVQDNLSFSKKGVLRGLHYQNPKIQAKLIQVVFGEVFDVVVDIRKDSATFGKWAGIRLSDKNNRQLFVPEGFAHGYCVLSEKAVFTYKCSRYYSPDCEKGILWSDMDIGIEWPVDMPILSEKDQGYPCLKDVAVDELPAMTHF